MANRRKNKYTDDKNKKTPDSFGEVILEYNLTQFEAEGVTPVNILARKQMPFDGLIQIMLQALTTLVTNTIRRFPETKTAILDNMNIAFSNVLDVCGHKPDPMSKLAELLAQDFIMEESVQTGKPVSQLIDEYDGDIDKYKAFMEARREELRANLPENKEDVPDNVTDILVETATIADENKLV